DSTLVDLEKKARDLRAKVEQKEHENQPVDPDEMRELRRVRQDLQERTRIDHDRDLERHQGDWAGRVDLNGHVSGVFTDYHYYGTGDIGGSPREDSVKRLEAIVTGGTAGFPPENEYYSDDRPGANFPAVKGGDGPVRVVSSNAEQMFLAITPAEAAGLPHYTGEMELTNHSAGSLTSQAYQKRWLRKEELLADAAEKASVKAEGLGA